MLRSQGRPPARLGAVPCAPDPLLSLIQCPLEGSSLPPARGASQSLVLSAQVVTLGPACLPQSWSEGSPTQGEDRCLPAGWHTSPLSHLWAVINPLGYYCLQPGRPHLGHRIILRALEEHSLPSILPTPVTLFPLGMSRRHCFASLGWVYGFRPISDQGIKDCPSVKEFQA